MYYKSSRKKRRAGVLENSAGLKLSGLFKGKSALQLLFMSFVVVIPLAIPMVFWQVNRAFSALDECEKRQCEVFKAVSLILSTCSNNFDSSSSSSQLSEMCTMSCPAGYKYRISIISNAPVVYCPLHGNLANKSISKSIPESIIPLSNSSNSIHLYPEIRMIPSRKNK
jgi:hypothetical protein